MAILGPQLEFKTKGSVTLTASTITNAVGTGNGTIEDVGASPDQTKINNNFADCTDEINALIVDVTAIRTALVNAGILSS